MASPEYEKLIRDLEWNRRWMPWVLVLVALAGTAVGTMSALTGDGCLL